MLRPVRALLFGLMASASCETAAAQELVPPRLVTAPEVVVPEDAEPLPEDAGVLLTLTIAADGTVTEAEIAQGLRQDVDALALEAAREMRFEPATRDGEPIPARVRFRFAIAQRAEGETGTGAGTGTGTGTGTVPADHGDEPRAGEGPEPDAQREGSPPTASAPAAESAEPASAEDTQGFGAHARIVAPEPGAVSRYTLQGAELTTVPGTFGEPLRVVQTMPGVARTPFGAGFYVVRGASFQNTGFMVDGFEVPLLYHLGAGPAVISSRFVDELNFYPGGFPVKYGRFTAGLIAVDTHAPANRFHLEGELDIFKASVLGVVPFDNGRGRISAAYRRSYYELLLPLIAPQINLFYQDWQVRVDYQFSDRLSAFLFYFGSEDSLKAQSEEGAVVSDQNSSTNLGYRFQRLIGGFDWKVGHGVRLAWRGTVGINDAELRQRDPGGVDTGLNLVGTFFAQRLGLIIPESDSLQTTVGVDLSATKYDATATFPIPPGYGTFPTPQATDSRVGPPLSINPIISTVAPYIEQKIDFAPLEVVAGLRLENLSYGRVARAEFDPRLVARYRLVEPLVFKVATGLFTQPPLPYHIAREFGNPSMLPQRAWQNSGGFELTLPEHFEVQSQAFYNRFYRMPRTTNDFIIDERTGEPRRQVYAADGNGQAYGLEVLIRRRVAEGLFGWISYTLSWSERFTLDGNTTPFSYDQRHNLFLAASYTWHGWRFGVRFTLSTGRPTRAVLSSDYDVECDCYRPALGPRTQRLPTYHQLDVRVDREFWLGDSLHGSVYLDIINIYNAQNGEGIQYQYDFGASARVPGLPFLPTLGVRLEYE